MKLPFAHANLQQWKTNSPSSPCNQFNYPFAKWPLAHSLSSFLVNFPILQWKGISNVDFHFKSAYSIFMVQSNWVMMEKYANSDQNSAAIGVLIPSQKTEAGPFALYLSLTDMEQTNNMLKRRMSSLSSRCLTAACVSSISSCTWDSGRTRRPIRDFGC